VGESDLCLPYRQLCLQSFLVSFALRSQIFRSVLKGINLHASLLTLKTSAQWSVQRFPPPADTPEPAVHSAATKNISVAVNQTILFLI
jgi:hypothetical protein